MVKIIEDRKVYWFINIMKKNCFVIIFHSKDKLYTGLLE